MKKELRRSRGKRDCELSSATAPKAPIEGGTDIGKMLTVHVRTCGWRSRKRLDQFSVVHCMVAGDLFVFAARMKFPQHGGASHIQQPVARRPPIADDCD